MDKLCEQVKLAEEAVKLIKEFFDLEGFLGENLYKSIKVDINTPAIIIDDRYEGVLEYDVVQAAKVVNERINGWGPCPSGFYDAIEEEKNDFESKFNELGKDEFINYVGRVYYVEYRCEAIVKELNALAEEYTKL